MSSPTNGNSSRAILWGGLLCGFMDITAACIFYGVLRGRSPILILQSVATGLLGADSYNGGLATAALGLFLHFVIAFSATTVFYLASRRINFLVQHPFVSGFFYGIFVYFFMQLVVVPLSAYPHKGIFTLTGLVTGLTIHVFCVGLPISLSVHRFSKSSSPIRDPLLELAP